MRQILTNLGWFDSLLLFQFSCPLLSHLIQFLLPEFLLSLGSGRRHRFETREQRISIAGYEISEHFSCLLNIGKGEGEGQRNSGIKEAVRIG